MTLRRLEFTVKKLLREILIQSVLSAWWVVCDFGSCFAFIQAVCEFWKNSEKHTMSLLYTSLIRPVLFQYDPELVHDVLVNWASKLQSHPGFTRQFRTLLIDETRQKPVRLWNLTFPNRVGLAAGFDKNVQAPWFWWMLGFGHIEFGGVTQFPQPGNPLPRIFRLPADKAIINRMGFNNDGMEEIAKRLEKAGPFPVPVGINIGKNKWVENDDAPAAYSAVLNQLYNFAGFFVVNVSSPNTPNLRKLQDKEALKAIFGTLQNEREKFQIRKPVLLKLAPDLSDRQREEVAGLVRDLAIDGLVISNTTLDRTGLTSPGSLSSQTGGLSGRPLRSKSTEMIRQFHTWLPEVPIIGSGGIFSVQDAEEKLAAGASLVQIYTGFIYQGPGLVRELAGMQV